MAKIQVSGQRPIIQRKISTATHNAFRFEKWYQAPDGRLSPQSVREPGGVPESLCYWPSVTSGTPRTAPQRSSLEEPPVNQAGGWRGQHHVQDAGAWPWGPLGGDVACVLRKGP